MRNSQVLLILLAIITNHFACQTTTIPTNMNKEKAKNTLEALYDQAITVVDIYSSGGTGEYVVIAHPEAKPTVKFFSRIDKQTGKINTSNLPKALWIAEMEQRLDKLLPMFDKFVFDVDIFSSLEIDKKNIPSLEEMLTQSASDATLGLMIYLFEPLPNDANAEIWSKISNLQDELNKYNFNTLSYNFSFYDADFFKDKDINQYHFGFKGIKEGDFEKEFKQQLNQRLVFELKKESPKPSTQDLVKIIDQKPSYLGSKIHYL